MTHSEYPVPTAAEVNTPAIPESFEFSSAFGEQLSQTLDLSTWTAGGDLASTYGRLEREVAEAVARETEYRKTVREVVFDKLGQSPDAPPDAGVYRTQISDLARTQSGLLFNGGVEASDGISVVHDTLPLTITQIGVTLVSYSGDQGTWAHRLYRRDLRSYLDDPVQEVIAVLQRRERRESQSMGGETMSELARRGIMIYAERAILRERSSAQWRLGHGSPAPYELLTGFWANRRDYIDVSLELIRWYVLQHKRFVFVPSAPRKRHWLTIGNALNPLEYAIVQTLKPDLDRMIDYGGYRPSSGVLPAMRDFSEEVAPQVVVGLYKVWEGAPAYLFYAHRDYAHIAAHIAMADSVLQEHRGFPMLIDLADTVCKMTFGVDTLLPIVQMAYATSDQPFTYLGERETRY